MEHKGRLCGGASSLSCLPGFDPLFEDLPVPCLVPIMSFPVQSSFFVGPTTTTTTHTQYLFPKTGSYFVALSVLERTMLSHTFYVILPSLRSLIIINNPVTPKSPSL